MPPTLTPKSSMSKKVHPTPLHNRPRGSVRAKSGCYTCRIRRKKCDEKRVGEETGPCETCSRLRLECLGFGAKRPDWLRDTNRVAEIRNRIKGYLASQGMIKGHSGSGSRMQVPNEYLRLSDENAGETVYPSGSSSSGESPAREDSIESDQYPHLPVSHYHNVSSIRSYDPFGNPADFVSSRCDSPMDPDQYYEWAGPSMVLPVESFFDTPAKKSQYSTLYHAHFTIDPEPDYVFDASNPSPTIIYPSNILPDHLISQSLREYVNNIVKVQYLFGDRQTLPIMIWDAVVQHVPSQEAVALLSQTYHIRQRNQNLLMFQDPSVTQRVSRLKEVLKDAESKFNADDAMAALHVVSLYLFEGGAGNWDEFLNFALAYTKKVLENPLYCGNYPDALECANAKDAFVVKTTIWFDVLASITTMKQPRLLDYIRALFRPGQNWRTYSMMSPMGCENIIVWALAETSTLAYWKRRCMKTGNLSIRHLVNQVQAIEPYLQPGPRPIPPCNSDESWSKYLTSEIFRTSTKLFLKTVESGDYPQVQEIRDCVLETYNAINDSPLSGTDDSASAIVRSTVFGYYICGSLTDNEQMLTMLRLQLTQKSGHEGVGNTTAISELLSELWYARNMQPPGHPVQWRRLLRQKQILLV